jgi:dihydroorotate dehydrogenase electron transfer subunit
MQTDTGIISVIQMEEDGTRSARIDSPTPMNPSPGKYILVYKDDDPDSFLGWPLFPVSLHQSLGESQNPFLGPIPSTWGPNTALKLCGPLGHGFIIPKNTRRLALVVLGDTASRLLPLIHPALDSVADIVIVSAFLLPSLPPAVEIRSLNALPDVLSWADFIAMDIPLTVLPNLRQILKLDPHGQIPCLAQALIWTPMPCAGIGDCGACAVPTRKGGYKLACKEGPVFDLNELAW